MQIKPLYHPEALAEYLAQIRYYESVAQGLGARFEADQHQAIERICQFPERFPLITAPNIRRISLQVFPFHVIYRLQADQAQILAVSAQRRQPGYWLGRVFSH